MKKIFIKPYKSGSKGASLLAKAVGGKKIKLVGSKYKSKPNHLLIQWGGNGLNKLEQFTKFKETDGLNIPQFTTEYSAALQLAEKWSIIVRSSLTGHSGVGITFCEEGMEIPQGKLYVQYIKKQHEYRVHVFNGKVIDIQQKRKKKDVPNEEINYKIRNHHTGWVYCRENLHIPPDLEQQAIKAVQALGYLFGAVDIIWNKKQNKCYVLEVNSAPGLEGETIVKYANAIKELANGNTC